MLDNKQSTSSFINNFLNLWITKHNFDNIEITFLFSFLICSAVLFQLFMIWLQRLGCKTNIIAHNPVQKFFNYLLISLKLSFSWELFAFFLSPIIKSYSRSKEMFQFSTYLMIRLDEILHNAQTYIMMA